MTTVAGVVSATAALILVIGWLAQRPMRYCRCGRCRKRNTAFPLCRLSADGATAWLDFENGPMGGRSVHIEPPALTVGSTAASDVVLSDPAVSEQHLVIESKGCYFLMTDNASTNGVYVNGIRERNLVLASGDRLRIGNSDVVVRLL